MDKIFTPNKFFVGFCGMLIIVVFVWQYFRDQLILEEAKEIGRQEAEWSWPSQGISTNVDEIQAKILKRTDNDAEVEVQGKQKIILQSAAPELVGKTQTSDGAEEDGSGSSDFKAVLTLYKEGNSRVWKLGKVEGQ